MADIGEDQAESSGTERRVDRLIGRRFSHLYVERGQHLSDSVKARVRLTTFLNSEFNYQMRQSLASYLTSEIGVGVSSGLEFKLLEQVDFLDSITLTYDFFCEIEMQESASRWLSFAERVFEEEHLGYNLDEAAGVHFLIDAEYSSNIQSAISGLSNSKYKQAERSLLAIQASLDVGDMRSAIRHAFDATESVFKVVLGTKVTRLGSSEIRACLRPQLDKCYTDTSLHAARLLTDSFGNWVSAAHFYRHVDGQADPPSPPKDLAIALISAAPGYVRWLIEIGTAIGVSRAS